ncbi:hypothetical protein MUK42_07189 [Musa troglodytarum]|uniref:Uncharacterized protein n=1 Tax=Musa troglodytarum TaxID=320322 RepID=A0A9E7EW63_9LILI|nr:hypothetical protein MUK42_07189 [Musa troglodytarum]
MAEPFYMKQLRGKKSGTLLGCDRGIWKLACCKKEAIKNRHGGNPLRHLIRGIQPMRESAPPSNLGREAPQIPSQKCSVSRCIRVREVGEEEHRVEASDVSFGVFCKLDGGFEVKDARELCFVDMISW